MKNLDKLAYCGLYCGGCKKYMHSSGCIGCRDDKEKVVDCPVRNCAVSKGLIHCGECGEFPCDILKQFYESGPQHRALAKRNIKEILLLGLERWLEIHESLHVCDCGKRRLWFDERCDLE